MPANENYVPLYLCPITLKNANIFVKNHHRHHRPTQGGLFAVAVASGQDIRGVAIIGRPLSRRLADGWTAEVVRVATDGTKNCCSMLYAAAWRACRSLGYRKLLTYILEEETGITLKAAGWHCVGKTAGGSWNSPSRPRYDQINLGPKLKFEIEVRKK